VRRFVTKDWWLHETDWPRAAYITIIIIAVSVFVILFTLWSNQQNQIKMQQAHLTYVVQRLCFDFDYSRQRSNKEIRIPLKFSLRADAQLLFQAAAGNAARGNNLSAYVLRGYANQLLKLSREVTIVKRISCDLS
jgi:hypothetical protein